MKWTERLKSWALWLSLASLIAFLVKSFFDLDIADWLNNFLDVLLPVLIAFGVVNNPMDRDHF